MVLGATRSDFRSDKGNLDQGAFCKFCYSNGSARRETVGREPTGPDLIHFSFERQVGEIDRCLDNVILVAPSLLQKLLQF